jgi:hypothetical protein
MMGGDVTAASEAGKGSIFTVRLPVADRPTRLSLMRVHRFDGCVASLGQIVREHRKPSFAEVLPA